MRKLFTVLALGFGFSLAWTGLTAERLAAGHIARLIDQLGSEEYLEREAATNELDAIGPECLEALKQASQNDDAEVRRRAVQLVSRIERRLENERLLTPKRVRVVYRDKPVAEAIQEFAQQTGYVLQLHGNTGPLAGRTVTLDTGVTTFWEAVEQFCRAANLNERDSGKPVSAAAREQQRKQQQFLILRESRAPNPAQADNRLFVQDGKAAALPTCYAGSIRIQSLPPAVAPARADNEVVLTLEATAEPALLWQTLVDVRIDKAIDDKGQELSQPINLSVNGQAASEVMWGNAGMVAFDVDGKQADLNTRQITVRLQGAKKPARQLKELSGTLTGRVQTPVQPLAAIDNILQAAGQSVDLPEGGTLKVLDVQHQAGGPVKVRIRKESAMPGVFLGNGVMRVNGRVMILQAGGTTTGLPAPSLTLADAKGQNFQLSGQTEKTTAVNPNGVTQEFELTFQPSGAQGEPARLVLNGRKTVALEVPFSLRDLPVP